MFREKCEYAGLKNRPWARSISEPLILVFNFHLFMRLPIGPCGSHPGPAFQPFCRLTDGSDVLVSFLRSA